MVPRASGDATGSMHRSPFEPFAGFINPTRTAARRLNSGGAASELLTDCSVNDSIRTARRGRAIWPSCSSSSSSSMLVFDGADEQLRTTRYHRPRRLISSRRPRRAYSATARFATVLAGNVSELVD